MCVYMLAARNEGHGSYVRGFGSTGMANMVVAMTSEGAFKPPGLPSLWAQLMGLLTACLRDLKAFFAWLSCDANHVGVGLRAQPPVDVRGA